MVTVGLDFGTHQTKICYETVESGTTFYEVLRFRKANGEEALTLPSFIRRQADGTLRYGHEGMSDGVAGPAITYFKQKTFSWTENVRSRFESEVWSALYLTYVILKLDAHLGTSRYIVQMGMPTDADPRHYDFCRRQAIKVLAGAMQMARDVFKGNQEGFLSCSCLKLIDLAGKCMSSIPYDVGEARQRYPIFVFPEAYVSLIPLINDHRLPSIGPNLFVDIGGGTVDISFFTNQMDGTIGRNRPYLYYYYSIPYGLNVITGQDLSCSHNVEVTQGQITARCVERFHQALLSAMDVIMAVLRQKYTELGKTNVIPFINLCSQILDGRPVCYSGGGSMFQGLKQRVSKEDHRGSYNFSQVTTVSSLIDHSKLYVSDKAFHILATAFALSHRSLVDLGNKVEPDKIHLVSLDKLFEGIQIAKSSQRVSADGGARIFPGQSGTLSFQVEKTKDDLKTSRLLLEWAHKCGRKSAIKRYEEQIRKAEAILNGTGS